MKEFNENHEAIINYHCVPETTDANEGDIIPHKKRVDGVNYYYRESMDADKYTKLWLSKDMILELADRIKQIESEKVDLPLDTSPF